MQRASYKPLIAMTGVLLLASFFYLYELNSISFWEDESWMAIAIGDGLADVWTFATNNGVHPPLYFYLAYVLKPLISDGEFALRWMGGLVTLIGIALTYTLGKDISKDWRVGSLAALVATGSIYLLYLTRLARHYTLFYTLSALIYVLYWRWLARPNRRTLIAIMLVQTALLYTHYFGAFIAVAIASHALLTRHPIKGKSWQVIVAFIGSGILYLPWLPSIWAQMNGDLGEGVYYAANKLRDIPENYIGRVTNANALFGVGFLIVGGVALIQQKRWSYSLLLLLTVVGTFIPIVIINQTVFQWYIGRNMLYTFPLVAVFYGIGMAYLWRSAVGKIVSSLFLMAFIGWGLLAYDAYYPGTADWRGIVRSIASEAEIDDTFVLRGEPYSTDYYLRQFWDDARVPLLPMADWVADPVITDRIWLIDSGQAVRFEAIDQIPANMQQTRRYVRLPVVAELYERVPDEPLATFGDQLALGYTKDTLTVSAGAILTVDMWWQAVRVPDFNYSASLQLWGDNGLVAQVDGNFDSGRIDAQVLPPEIWIPDTRQLLIPSDLPAGEYDLRLTVYDWRDGTRLSVMPDVGDNLTYLTTVTIN